MRIKVICVLILIGLLTCGCSKKVYTACTNQPLEEVVSIELLDMHNNESVLYTMSESEIPSFWEELMTIEFHRCFNDPTTEYGILAIRITYKDGSFDIIGTDINGYYDSEGKGLRTGWFYVADKNDYIRLFSQYIEQSLLPSIG